MKWRYVLITPARNEGRYVGKAIESLLAQTVLPERWVIVSDSSTDDTEATVNRYKAQHPTMIILVRRQTELARSYGSKVRAIWAGSQGLCDVEYDFIGVLDADVTFQPNYYESVLKEFDCNRRLGIAGGITVRGEGLDFPLSRGLTERFVPGPIQLFRRECYEEIRGLRALKHGGEDTVALEMAMARGWQVRTFPDLIVHHHRGYGTEGLGLFPARFRHGLEDYSVGYHPLFELAKCARRVGERPYVFGSLFRIGGYLWGGLVGRKREVPAEFVRHIRTQQMRRLRSVADRS